MIKKEWSAARLRSFIVSALRAASSRYPPKYECLKEAKVGKQVNKASGRLADHYKCAKCKKLFVLKDVQVDHIEPVIDPLKGFETWDIFISRLFCSKTNLQVMCKNCHTKKTLKERQKKA